MKYEPTGFDGLFSAAIYELTKTNISVTNIDTGDRDLVGEIRVKGLDLEAKAELTPDVAVTASYSYADSEVLRSDPIFGTPVALSLIHI